MRTTITLDPDVAALVHRHMSERGLSFKDAVNSALRESLAPASPCATEAALPVFDMGEPKVPLEQALRLAADLEDEEIARKLGIGK